MHFWLIQGSGFQWSVPHWHINISDRCCSVIDLNCRHSCLFQTNFDWGVGMGQAKSCGTCPLAPLQACSFLLIHSYSPSKICLKQTGTPAGYLVILHEFMSSRRKAKFMLIEKACLLTAAPSPHLPPNWITRYMYGESVIIFISWFPFVTCISKFYVTSELWTTKF